MTECKAEVLLLSNAYVIIDDNLHSSIVKELSIVSFCELKELSLSI